MKHQSPQFRGCSIGRTAVAFKALTNSCGLHMIHKNVLLGREFFRSAQGCRGRLEVCHESSRSALRAAVHIDAAVAAAQRRLTGGLVIAVRTRNPLAVLVIVVAT